MATISLSRKALRMGKAGVPVNDWNDLIIVLNAIVTLVTEIKTDLTAHTHTGGGASVVALANDLKAKYNVAVTLANEVKADHNALLAKLDADAGVTDTNYAALHTTAAADSAVTAVADSTNVDSGVGATISAATPDTLAIVK